MKYERNNSNRSRKRFHSQNVQHFDNEHTASKFQKINHGRKKFEERQKKYESVSFYSNKESNDNDFSFLNALRLALMNANELERAEKAEAHCPFAIFPYEQEIQFKLNAIRYFFDAHRLSSKLIRDVVPSPLGRPCRTTSKRRVFVSKNCKIRFAMGYGELFREETIVSPLEPENHGKIYQKLHDLFQMPAFFPLAKLMNFVIIRGNYESFAVILNVSTLDAQSVRRIHKVAEIFQHEFPFVKSMFTFLSPKTSQFYLESKSVTHPFRKVFGPEMLDVTVNQKKLFFPAGSFSQVNLSILDKFVVQAQEWLAPDGNTDFYDLYCGYGLFSIVASGNAGKIFGIDYNGPAIHSAMENAVHCAPEKHIKFIPAPITASFIREKMQPPMGDEVFLLDPPRSGVAAGVIPAIAERHPLRVLHVFCSVDEIPKAMLQWRQQGYQPEKVRVFDMFPGTPNVETMILLKKKSSTKKTMK